MTLTVTHAFDLPSREDITAQEFVIKLRAEDDAARDAKLVRDYVFTPTVRRELPPLLERMKHVMERREELGKLVHGSFGSGKSHFMALLGMLLGDRDVAWSKDDPLLDELRPHRSWIGEARLLVVRIHMLTASDDDATFDRMIYRATNEALARHGAAPFEHVHVDGILEEMRREGAQYGEQFWEGLKTAGVLSSEKAFERLVKRGEPADRELLAREYLRFKGRDLGSAGINPNWAEGMQRLAAHVKTAGFGGLVLLIDELLLWLGEKNPQEFKKAINQLNTLVDHADGRRAIPCFVFVARQRRMEEFFPDMADDDAVQQYLDHHSKRFDEITLQDVELRHICRERVLKRKVPEAVAKVVASLEEDHRKILPTLLQNADVDYLRDVYPFHPALIEMLIDISSLMQRERTALRLLYELLVVHHPDLPLGKFLPVGRAFEAIFPEGEKPSGSKRLEELQSVHTLYYGRFRPAMDEMMSGEGPDVIDADQRQMLDQLVKTALLAELSPRLRGGGMNVERLVRLNDVDVVGHSERGQIIQARQAMVTLGQKVRALQVVGEGRTASVKVVLHGANFEEYLSRAKSKVRGDNVLLRHLGELLQEALALNTRRWKDPLSGPFVTKWRGTERTGWVGIKNVREQPNATFKPEPGEAFRILIDYPWDEKGYDVEHDRQRAKEVRRRDGSYPTLCWLPRHLTPSERSALEEYAAAEYLASDRADDLLESLGKSERDDVIKQARSHLAMMRSKVLQTLRHVYQHEVVGLIGNLDGLPVQHDLGPNLHRFAAEILDVQFPQHPTFEADPSPKNLGLLYDWLVEAAESAEQSAPFTSDVAPVLRGLGEPLELLELGQTRGRLRPDTRFLKEVLDLAQGERVAWGKIDEVLAQKFGFEPAVRNLFLGYLAQVQRFRMSRDNGEDHTFVLDAKPHTQVILERAALLDVTQWAQVRERAQTILGVTAPAHCTVSEQDRLAAKVVEAADAQHRALRALHESLAKLLGAQADDAPRLQKLREAIKRMATVMQAKKSHQRLLALLAAWPDDADDAHREVLASREVTAAAVDAIDETSRTLLARRKDDAATAHLQTLVAKLASGPLAPAAIQRWNEDAVDILASSAMAEAVGVGGAAATAPEVTPVARQTAPPSAPIASGDFAMAVDCTRREALDDFLGALRVRLQKEKGRRTVKVIIEEDG
ncbi:MAG: hypothetical protein KC731_31520 [Myxococcales bacterium]|nr:hypothetical protein [Myxococcales bacterium]